MSETTHADTVVNPTPDPAAALAALRGFVAGLRPEQRVACLYDSDADGVAAGVVWQRGMERLGFSELTAIIPNRERNAWAPENQRRLRDAAPEALFVLDLGSQPVSALNGDGSGGGGGGGVPECYIDHHRPEGMPPGATLISAYTWEPIPNTSLIVYDLLRGYGVAVDDLEWVAAVGTLSDLGEKAPFPIIDAAKKRYTAKYLKEATALVNAARRASRYAPEIAARALLHHDGPRALVEAADADAQALRDARAEVKAEMEEAKKAAPAFAGPVALIRVHSACQIHPLIAQIWRGRLPNHVVIAANDAYLPGRVNFSARSGARTPTGALELLRRVELSEGEGHFGHGHDAASGGSLPYARWNELLGKLGFGEAVYAAGG